MFKTWLKTKSDFYFTAGALILIVGMLWNAVLHGGDFEVFYLAGRRFLEGVAIYQPGDDWMPFKYHPAWSLFFSLWTLLPLKASLLIFSAVNIAFWAAAYFQWARILKYQVNPFNVFIVLLLSLNALSAETAYGQLNGFLFWGATKIFIWMEEDSSKSIRCGMLLALLISLKLNFGVFLFYVLGKNPRSVWGLLAGGLALHGLIALAFGDFLNFGLYESWLKLLLTQSEAQFNIFEAQGILRLCYVIFGASIAKSIWLFLFLIFVAIGLLLPRMQFKSNRELLMPGAPIGCYWFAVLFFFSPLSWWYQILYLFPFAFMLLKIHLKTNWRPVVLGCLLIFALASFNTLGREGIFIFKFYMGYFVVGAVLSVSYLFSDAFSLKEVLERSRMVSRDAISSLLQFQDK